MVVDNDFLNALQHQVAVSVRLRINCDMYISTTGTFQRMLNALGAGVVILKVKDEVYASLDVDDCRDR